jgi:hypothetical protein
MIDRIDLAGRQSDDATSVLLANVAAGVGGVCSLYGDVGAILVEGLPAAYDVRA